MLFRKKDKQDKPRERFYLFPGQGGRNYYRKQRTLIAWSIFVALLGGVLLTAAMWWLSRPKL